MRGGLLWQHEVNQHSVHAAFFFPPAKLLRTCGSSHICSHGRTCDESTAMKRWQSAAGWSDNDTAVVDTGGMSYVSRC